MQREEYLEEVLKEQVHCLHYTECQTEKDNRCYTHVYYFCETFKSWYDNGGKEEIQKAYRRS